MKKRCAFVMATIFLFTAVACGNSTTPKDAFSSIPSEAGEKSSAGNLERLEEPSGNQESIDPNGRNAQSLIVYFSWSNHTAAVASEIQNQTGADLFELVPQTPYPDDYNTLLDIAQQEQRDNARPDIDGAIDNIDQYDVIYLGFPNWWADMPMILYRFLDDYDLSGMTIVPFCTSGGSGFSDTLNTIRELEPDADVLRGLHIGSAGAATPNTAVTEWLDELGING